MRVRTNMALKERKTLSLGDFKGVDFSTSPLEVSPHRATDMVNLINEYGTNRKRNGWCELFRIENDARGGRRINGVFEYEDYLIVHAGARFFKVVKVGEEYEYIDITESGTYEPSKVDTSRLADARSEAYLLKKRLYIIGAGDFLVYGTWDDGKTYELRRVENDEDTYIPTTTININCDAESDNDVRGTLDMPNLLCKKRINQLVGIGSENASWLLDSAIETGSKVEIRIESYDNIGNIDENKYINDPADESGGKNVYLENDDTKVKKGEIDFEEGRISLYFATPTSQNMDNIYVTFAAAGSEPDYRIERFTGGRGYEGTPLQINLNHPVDSIENVEIRVTYSYTKNNKKEIFYLYMTGKPSYHLVISRTTENPWGLKAGDRVGKISADGEINFYISTQAYVSYVSEGVGSSYQYDHLENNITVKYYPAHTDTETEEDEEKDEDEKLTADAINNCTFGTLFGIYGNTDRLFVTGNEEHPNMDFYSGMDDFTYFTDEQTAALGSDSSPIGGYARLSDSTLIVYKNDADREASIYYRTGKQEEEYDADGALIEGRAIFPLTAGSIGESVISRQACVNFAGDTLMLSRNGVFGVVLGNNVLSTERHTRERSRAINERLCKQNLSEAVGVVYGNRYYLAVDGVCYVADSRYKYTRKDDIDGSYNYEWWYFDNMPVRVWAVLNGKLCFGCADGRVCVFDEEYTDRIHLRTQAGDLGYSENSASITYSERIREEFAVGDTLKVLSSDIYALYLGADGCEVEDGRAAVSAEAIVGIYEGTEVYADGVGDSGLEVGVKYTVCDVDPGKCTFGLMREDGEVADLISGGFRLHRLISGLELKVKTKDDEHFTLWREGFGDIIISRYNDGALPTEAICKITHKDNIVASWYSPVFDLGTNMAVKTILGITVAASPDYGGRVSFGFESKHALGEWALKGTRVFSFDDLSFDDFSFDTRFMSSYTVRLNRRNVNYVIFRFVSDDDKGCAVHNLKVLYKINKNNRGVV